MGRPTPWSKDVLLAVALGSRRRTDRRVLPDRRTGIDRRKTSAIVATERRSHVDRRQVLRRQGDAEEGATLLQKARTRMMRSSGSKGRGANGLR